MLKIFFNSLLTIYWLTNVYVYFDFIKRLFAVVQTNIYKFLYMIYLFLYRSIRRNFFGFLMTFSRISKKSIVFINRFVRLLRLYKLKTSNFIKKYFNDFTIYLLTNSFLPPSVLSVQVETILQVNRNESIIYR